MLLFFSSPHSFSIGFRSEDWNGHSRSLVLISVTHFCVIFEVCVWIIVRLEDQNMAHYKISNRVSHLFIFYLLVFDRIHDAMCINKISRTSRLLLTPRLDYFLLFSSCGPWRVFRHSNSPSHRALGWYRHMSSSRQFHNILCWLEILYYCPDGGNGNFHCSSSFIKANSLICEAQLSFAAHQKYITFPLLLFI